MEASARVLLDKVFQDARVTGVLRLLPVQLAYLALSISRVPAVWIPVLIIAEIGSGVGLTCFRPVQIIQLGLGIASVSRIRKTLEESFEGADTSRILNLLPGSIIGSIRLRTTLELGALQLYQGSLREMAGNRIGLLRVGHQ